jgi:hypothetical protein
MGSTSTRDDRILPLTRVVAGIVIAILILAFIVLFVFPNDTDRRFAWTIKPSMTAMLMGAGYGSALFFFIRVVTERRWHRVALGFLPTTTFTWMMLGDTFLHWEKFRHGSAPFLLWLWIYLITPVLVPAVWLVNRPHDPGTPEDGDPPYPSWMRSAMAAAGVGMSLIAVWMYVFPTSAISVWPWMLTPLTARAVAAFVALPGVGWLMIASDERWSSARVLLGTIAIGLVLLLVAVARAWSEFDHGSVFTYIYVGGLVGTLATVGALTALMRRRVDPARG